MGRHAEEYLQGVAPDTPRRGREFCWTDRGRTPTGLPDIGMRIAAENQFKDAGLV